MTVRPGVALAAVAAVEVTLAALRASGRVQLGPRGPEAWGYAAFVLAAVAAVLALGARGRTAALGVAALALPLGMSLVGAAWLVALWLVTWAIARIPAPLALRLAAVAVLCLVPGAIRGGLLGPPAVAWMGTPARFEQGIWFLQIARALLYQVERPRLEARDRGFLTYLGCLGLFPFGGATLPIPIPHGTVLGSHAGTLGARALWRGAGLVAVGVALAAAAPHVQALAAQQWNAVPASPEGLAAWVDAGGRARFAGLIALYLPARYVNTAAALFLLVGHARLLGFDLASGFRRPFLASNFVEFWRRWNFHYRDAAMTLFYWPAAGVLRGRVGPRATAFAGVLAAFAGLAVLEFFLQPWAVVLPWRSPPSRIALVLSGRMLAVGLVTALTAAWLSARRRATPASAWARAAAVCATLTAVTLLAAVTRLSLRGVPAQQTVALLATLVGAGP